VYDDDLMMAINIGIVCTIFIVVAFIVAALFSRETGVLVLLLSGVFISIRVHKWEP
jgi:hypothetical protein